MKKNKKYAIKIRESFLIIRENMEQKYFLSSLINYSDSYKTIEDAREVALACREYRIFRDEISVCEIKQIGGYYKVIELETYQPIPIVPLKN